MTRPLIVVSAIFLVWFATFGGTVVRGSITSFPMEIRMRAQIRLLY